MYLHLGTDTVVRTGDILGIFDLDTTTVSAGTRELLAQAQKQGRVINVAEGLPKSFVVMAGRDPLIYISRISARTLHRRSGYLDDAQSAVSGGALPADTKTNGKEHENV